MNIDELILTHILQCSRSELYLQKPSLTELQQKQFDSYLARYRQGEPLQYILGVCNFMGFDLKVDPRVLIPRPETEILVEEAVKRVKGIDTKEPRILDLGTGSGNITIALAKLLFGARITSIDISKDALVLAHENALKHGVEGVINFIHADMLNVEVYCNTPLQFDLIISNPPYISKSQMSQLPKDVQQEPHLALEGGVDGLNFYRAIIKMTPGLLRGGGYLMMEFGDDQDLAIKELVLACPQLSNVQVLQDLAGRNRIICVQRT